MLRGININETSKYVSKSDPDPKNPTIFQLGVLDSFAMAHIEDQTTKYDFSGEAPNVQINAGARAILTVKFGIKGIEGLIDPHTSSPIKVTLEKQLIDGREYSIVPDSILSMLPRHIFSELSEEIRKANVISEEESGN